MDLDRYKQLRDKVDGLQREADRAQGNLDQLMQQLKDEFDCDELEVAKVKLTAMELSIATEEKEFEAQVREFEEEWGDQI